MFSPQERAEALSLSPVYNPPPVLRVHTPGARVRLVWALHLAPSLLLP